MALFITMTHKEANTDIILMHRNVGTYILVLVVVFCVIQL